MDGVNQGSITSYTFNNVTDEPHDLRDVHREHQEHPADSELD